MGDCADSECSIDEVDNLISTLKAQQEQLKTRLALVSGMVDKLQHVNEKEDREVSEVRQYVRDFLRVSPTRKVDLIPQDSVEMLEREQPLRMMPYHRNHGR